MEFHYSTAFAKGQPERAVGFTRLLRGAHGFECKAVIFSLSPGAVPYGQQERGAHCPDPRSGGELTVRTLNLDVNALRNDVGGVVDVWVIHGVSCLSKSLQEAASVSKM